MTQLTNMFDTSPESYVHGAVYKLLLMPIALNYCEYKAKFKAVFFNPSLNICNKCCMFFHEKIRHSKNIGHCLIPHNLHLDKVACEKANI